MWIKIIKLEEILEKCNLGYNIFLSFFIIYVDFFRILGYCFARLL